MNFASSYKHQSLEVIAVGLGAVKIGLVDTAGEAVILT